MSLHELIFSDKRNIRITRHVLFWLCWYLYVVSTQLRNMSPEKIGWENFIIYQFGISFNRLLLQIIFCYTILYYLIPVFTMKKKTWLFILLLAGFLFGYYGLTFLAYSYSTPFFRGLAQQPPLSPFLAKYYILYSNIHFTGTLVAFSIILMVKYYKSWYLKQKENEMLVQENALAELQLLKAQVHPHFLFNTLNNIYSLSLDCSPKTSIVINKLSGTLHYMITEGAASRVTLDKEIKMLLDYIGLEKIRYGERLILQTDIRITGYEKHLIAPILMIPFVENCFKHGASKLLENAWINMTIETDEDRLRFKISNNSPTDIQSNQVRQQLGLMNVKKRLKLLYLGKHLLEIKSSKDSFFVYLELELQKLPSQTGERNSQAYLKQKNMHA